MPSSRNCFQQFSAADGPPTWSVMENGLIQGPGLQDPVPVSEAIPHIEALYREHFFGYFTYRGKPLPDWCHTLEFECKMLGRNIALHGAASYAIDSLPGSGEPPVIKARGHALNAEHYHPDTAAIIECPMGRMMKRRLYGQAMETRQASITYKPASVNDYKTRREFRVREGLPGYSIARRTGVRLITLSEFNFPDANTRRMWKQYYAYVNRHYDMGLEVACVDPDKQDDSHMLTIEQLEAAKLDYQTRIWDGQLPGARRIRGKNKNGGADQTIPQVLAGETIPLELFTAGKNTCEIVYGDAAGEHTQSDDDADDDTRGFSETD